MNKPRAVLFDLDDTLLDRESAYEATYTEFYHAHPEISENGDINKEMKFFWSLSPHGTTDAQDAARQIMNRWPSLDLDPVEFEAWFFNTLASKAKVIDGALDLLTGLNQINFPWAIVTNGKKFQVTKLRHSGLVEIVPFAIVSLLFGANKPDPRIYHEAVRRLKLSFDGIDGIQPSEILFVGDNPYTDITGAITVGMKTAWIHVNHMYDQYPSDAPKPDMQINSVVELRELVGLGVV